MSSTENRTPNTIDYHLKLMSTSACTGYFACCPAEDTDLNTAIDYLRQYPNDDFMHKHALNLAGDFAESEFISYFESLSEDDYTVLAILFEAIITNDKFSELKYLFDSVDIKTLSENTPLIYIRSWLMEDQEDHFRWIKFFRKNVLEHQGLTPPERCSLPELFNDDFRHEPEYTHIREFADSIINDNSAEDQAPVAPGAIADAALEKLNALNIFAEVEMRHQASLCPIALIRKWNMDVSVQNGGLNYNLTGIQNSYGKGLSLDTSRASNLMEVVERYSSFAGFDAEGTVNYLNKHKTVQSGYSELVKAGINALDPNDITLEIKYNDEPLHWIEGVRVEGGTEKPVMVPAQLVFLFCNLDEVSLFSGLGSTGLASGSSHEGARVSALMEVIERDAEAVTPFDTKKCFTVYARHPQVAPILEHYKSEGISIQFQNLTTGMGVPVYKCFVIGEDSEIVRSSGAHLDAQKALISAMTETPWAYPSGPKSAPSIPGLPVVNFETLPDYSTGSPSKDLKLLETLLNANGYSPIYIDLTRDNPGFPVVKAIVPGMELMNDFDSFSRVNPKLYKNYLKMFGS